MPFVFNKEFMAQIDKFGDIICEAHNIPNKPLVKTIATLVMIFIIIPKKVLLLIRYILSRI